MDLETKKKSKMNAKRSITAFEANDGSLHRTELDRDRCDAQADYDSNRKAIAQLMSNEAPYVDDWHANAASGPEDFLPILDAVLDDPIFDALLAARNRLDSLNKS